MPLLTSQTRHTQKEWTIGHCPHCSTFGPARIEDAHRHMRIWFIPIGKEFQGQVARCDICEEPVTRVLSGRRLALPERSPSEGIHPLLQRLNADQSLRIDNTLSELHLRSLLSEARKRSSLGQINAAPGILVGLLGGFGTGLMMALLLLEAGFLDPGLNRVRCLVLGGAAGAFVGAFVIGAVYCRLISRRVALSRLRSVYIRYHFDMRVLRELSENDDVRVRSAVQMLTDEIRLLQDSSER